MLAKIRFGDKLFLVTLIVLAVFFGAGFFFIVKERSADKGLYLQKEAEVQRKVWNSVVNTHKVGMKAYYEAYINTDNVNSVLQNALHGTSDVKQKSREKLLWDLKKIYFELGDRNVKQLHFHDPDNNSFLRFHMPQKYGDSLNASRPSVVIANKHLVPVQGFETGRVASGFRNVFPIVYKGEHLGSVELSQPFEAIRNEMSELDNDKNPYLVIKAESIYPKIFDSQKMLYEKSPFSEKWVIEKSQDGTYPKADYIGISKLLKNNQEFLSKLAAGENFGLEVVDGLNNYAVVSTSVFDVEQKHVASLVSIYKSTWLEKIERDFYFNLFYLSGFFTLLLFVIFWLFKNRRSLEIERRKMSLIAESMTDGLYVMDSDGITTYINKSALRILELKKEDIIGKIAHDIFHSHSQNNNLSFRFCPIYTTTIKQHAIYQGMDSFKTKNGDVFFADITSAPIIDKGEVIGSVTVFRDINERMQYVHKINELAASIPGMIFQYRLQKNGIGEFAYISASCFQIFGVLPTDAIKNGELILQKIHSADLQKFKDSLGASAKTMSTWNCEFRVISNGKVKWVEGSAIPKKESFGVITWHGYISDITDKKETSESLLIQQHKLAQLGSMVGAIAHQWKQPLNTFWIAAQNLKISHELNELTKEDMDEFISKTKEQVKFMSQTIDDFKNFYKPSTTKQIFDVYDAIKSTIPIIAPQLKKMHISLILELQKDIHCYGYEGEFKHVLVNLIANANDAFKHTADVDRKISILLYSDHRFAITEIIDNAGGIEGALLPDKIFEPYFTTKGENGTGIGLSLSKIIIEGKMEGFIFAENVDKGAKFTIKLPLSDKPTPN